MAVWCCFVCYFQGDLVVHDPRPMVHLKPYEAQLKKFRYTDALNAALKVSIGTMRMRYFEMGCMQDCIVLPLDNNANLLFMPIPCCNRNGSL